MKDLIKKMDELSYASKNIRDNRKIQEIITRMKNLEHDKESE